MLLLKQKVVRLPGKLGIDFLNSPVNDSLLSRLSILGRSNLMLILSFLKRKDVGKSNFFRLSLEQGQLERLRFLLRDKSFSMLVALWTDASDLSFDETFKICRFAVENRLEDFLLNFLRYGNLRLDGKSYYAPIKAREFLRRGQFLRALKSFCEPRPEQHESVLHLAAGAGFTKVVKLLLERGVSADVRNFSGSTPLHIACKKGYLEIARLLIDNGADINAVNSHNETPISFAAYNRNSEIVRLLLDKGALIDKNAFECAAGSGDIESVKLFIQRGIDKSRYHSALVEAIENGHIEVVQLLIDRGINIHAKTWCGTLLHYAAQSKNVEIVNFLLDRGLKMEVRDLWGRTPLHLAAAFIRPGSVRALLSRGARVNVRNKEGQTPLHCLFIEGRLFDILAIFRGTTKEQILMDIKEIFHLLVNAGASLKVKDKEGKTPLDYASKAVLTYLFP